MIALKKYKIPVFLFVLLAMSSCFRYSIEENRYHIVKESYPKFDSIILNKVYICQNYRDQRSGLFKPTGGFNEDYNTDSIYTLLNLSFTRSNVNLIEAEDFEILCDRSHYWRQSPYYYFLTLKNIKDEEMFAVNESNLNYPEMVAFVQVTTNDYHSPGNGYKRAYFIYLVVLIFHDEEIIYKTFNMLSSPSLDTDYPGITLEELNNVEQKHWDKLVYKTMKRYTKRKKHN